MIDSCYITKARQGGIYLEGTYSPEFVALIKKHVPADQRQWDAELKRWWVSAPYTKQATIDAYVCYEQVFEV